MDSILVLVGFRASLDKFMQSPLGAGGGGACQRSTGSRCKRTLAPTAHLPLGPRHTSGCLPVASLQMGERTGQDGVPSSIDLGRDGVSGVWAGATGPCQGSSPGKGILVRPCGGKWKKVGK